VTRILSADWVLPVEGAPIEDGAVAIEAGRIAAVGTTSELGEGERFDGAAIVPGFVNAHTHLEYAVYGGFGDGLADFSDWIAVHIERKDRLRWEDHLDIARLGVAECLASGVTTVGDCSYSGAAAAAAAELGLRATIYLEVFGADVDSALAQFVGKRDRVVDCFSERVRLGVSPHAPYSVSLDVYRACAELGVPLATHLSESLREVEYLRDGGGEWGRYAFLVPSPEATGTRLLAAHGLLGPTVLAAHCTHVDAEEIALLAEHGVGVAHCPRSNAILGCGVAPLTELRAAGVRVGLGTDSPASAPSFDFFEELRTAVLSARARAGRADALAAHEALELATIGSARALGLDGDVGSLVQGKRADLAIVSVGQTAYVPWEDPAAAVVLGGSPGCVLATLVDGEERYRKEVFPWQRLRSAAASARSRMLARNERAAVEAVGAAEAAAGM
jgi:cytosine/adenosine deaminase-related metal-dependent hydrolase